MDTATEDTGGNHGPESCLGEGAENQITVTMPAHVRLQLKMSDPSTPDSFPSFNLARPPSPILPPGTTSPTLPPPAHLRSPNPTSAQHLTKARENLNAQLQDLELMPMPPDWRESLMVMRSESIARRVFRYWKTWVAVEGSSESPDATQSDEVRTEGHDEDSERGDVVLGGKEQVEVEKRMSMVERQKDFRKRFREMESREQRKVLKVWCREVVGVELDVNVDRNGDEGKNEEGAGEDKDAHKKAYGDCSKTIEEDSSEGSMKLAKEGQKSKEVKRNCWSRLCWTIVDAVPRSF